jgi:hypothetical protein
MPINWKQIERKRNADRNRYFRKFRKALNEQVKPVKKALSGYQGEDIESISTTIDLLITDETISRVFDDLYKDVGLYYMENVEKLVQQKDLLTEDDWLEIIAQLMRDDVAEFVNTITSTTKADMIRLIKEQIDLGYANGESIQDIAKRLERAVPLNARKSNRFRAKNIAMTEVGRVESMASNEAANQLSIEVVKIWNTAPWGIAKKERHNLCDVDGQVRKMDESFDVCGEQLRFPLDPMASAENTINCRCVVTYRPV